MTRTGHGKGRIVGCFYIVVWDCPYGWWLHWGSVGLGWITALVIGED